MNQMSYDRFAPLVRPEGLVISNAGMVKAAGAHGAAALVEIDASGLANRLGNVRVANMVMLGALLVLKPLAGEREAAALLEKKLGTEPGKREILDLNKRALEVGAAEARKAVAERS
jgi:2-oxoglutarate ferredoxin oxidoreductase subunit gamma